jgi:transketolase
VRPADANETTYAWKVALEREEGPVALILSRQDLPVLERGEGLCADASGTERGGYVLWESNGDTTPEVIVLATGSEVWVALAAARLLGEEGHAVRVVSLPCWELFQSQPASYRDEVLPPECEARISVEAAVSQGWERWVGSRGDTVSIEHYGASAPGATVLEKLGINPDNVAMRARALLQRLQHVAGGALR